MPEIMPELLHKLCTDKTIFMTQHMALRCRDRKIRYADIKHAILTGRELGEQMRKDKENRI